MWILNKTCTFCLFSIAIASALVVGCTAAPTPAAAPTSAATAIPVASAALTPPTAAPASPTGAASPTLSASPVPTAQPTGPTAVVPTAPPTPTVRPTATPGPSPTPVTVPTSTTEIVLKLAQNAQLGNILTDAAGMTLYTYKNDAPDKSNCTGDCATLWPPLTIGFNVTPAAASGIPGNVGVLERADGTYQIWYNDAPLYRYSNDTKPGDTNGSGVDGLWSVVVVPAQTPTPATTGAPAATATSTPP